MTISVTMLAPVAGGSYVAQSGTIYTADANRLIVVTNTADVINLAKLGCTVANEPRAEVTQSNSSAAVSIVQGATNIIPTSSLATPFVLSAPATLGSLTSIINQSTGVPTITSSLATLYDEHGAAKTVLTGSSLGLVELEATGSTSYQIKNRSILTSSGGIVYSIASS